MRPLRFERFAGGITPGSGTRGLQHAVPDTACARGLSPAVELASNPANLCEVLS